MALIAAALEEALAHRDEDAPGRLSSHLLACGDGWSASDVICTCGPRDRPFGERHTEVSIALVVAGSFQYRSTLGRALMTPGSVMLGNAGQCFECGHDHAAGDRCVSFWYSRDFFGRVASDAGMRGGHGVFTVPSLPPLRALTPLLARAAAGIVDGGDVAWDELSIAAAALAIQLSRGVPAERRAPPPSAEARVTRVVRRIQHEHDEPLTLQALAGEARLSPYHFLRTFQQLTGVTPHQFLLRARLRDAAVRLLAGRMKILDAALDSGFADVSNFNRAFRAEFGVSPREYRRGRAVLR